MGVAKNVDFKNTGLVLGYWRINYVGVDIESNEAKVRVGGYLSKSEALAGKKAIDNITYNFFGSDNPIGLMTDPRDYQTLLYAKIIGQLGGGLINNKLLDGDLVSDLPD